MTIMSIITEFGMIRLLCIGEWSVQTFVTHVVVGQRVRKMDELGYFDLGSQVILALPSSANMLVKGGSKLFVGDPVAICQSRLAQGEKWAVEIDGSNVAPATLQRQLCPPALWHCNPQRR